MANNPFDRTTFGLRERPVSSDFNRGFSQADRTLRDLLATMFSARSLTSTLGVPYTGFLNDSFRCVPTSPLGMSVQLHPGLGFYYTTEDVPFDIGLSDLEAVDDRSVYKPMFLIAPQTFAVPAAPTAGNSRIDIIEVKYNRQLTGAETRRQLDVSTVKFLDHVFFKGISFQLDTQTGIVNDPSPSIAPLGYKIGVVAPTGSEIEPAASPGYIKIARINVGPAVTTIGSDSLVDLRALVHPGGSIPFSGRWRLRWNSGAPIVTPIAVNAPPGVHVGLYAPGIKGAGILFVSGGKVATAAVTMTASHQTGQDFADRFSIGLQSANAFTGSQITTVDAPTAALMASAFPPIIVGIGSKVVNELIISRFVTNTGASNNNDASLDDALVCATGMLSYS